VRGARPGSKRKATQRQREDAIADRYTGATLAVKNLDRSPRGAEKTRVARAAMSLRLVSAA
jgi:hypothetical protein